MPGFVLLVRDRRDNDPAMRLGITVTKKIGNAVIRNRMKRRFRALAREILPEAGLAGSDHILIGRAGGVERDFAQLSQELAKALSKLRRTGNQEPAAGREQANRGSTSSPLAGLKGNRGEKTTLASPEPVERRGDTNGGSTGSPAAGGGK
jgi:ribonuclease P protein component